MLGGCRVGSREVGDISRSSPNYPKLLNEVSDAPNPLYFLGDYKESLFTNTLAVVGSRAVTMYGEWVVKNIVKEVARCGVTIVSGFMYGVDALAHRAALEAEGSTIAVMAGGIDKIFPKYQEQLYFDIVDRGLVVSEFYISQANTTASAVVLHRGRAGGDKSHAGSSSRTNDGKKFGGGGWMFARRNRIVAGLSYATLVVEAAEGSGSLITASYAKQYGRQLLAVPANLNSRNAFGTTQLLRDGAKMITCADDILELYYKDPNNYRHNISGAVNMRLMLDKGDNTAQTILDLLYLEPLSADEISAKLNTASTNVLKCLTELTVLGQVCEREGRYYAG